MILSVKERLVLSMIMEQQAGRADVLKLIRKFREDLSFSEAEIRQINLKQNDDGTGFVWDPDKGVEKDVPIGEVAMGVIKKQFQKLDREERLMEEHLDLYAKFVPSEETKPAV
jgi:hypothetical protein